jgi:hypothetical protein
MVSFSFSPIASRSSRPPENNDHLRVLNLEAKKKSWQRSTFYFARAREARQLVRVLTVYLMPLFHVLTAKHIVLADD